MNAVGDNSVPIDYPETMARCLVQVVSRNERDARFVVSCIPNNEDLDKRSALKQSLTEFKIFVTVSVNSKSDSFFRSELRRPEDERVLLVWLDHSY